MGLNLLSQLRNHKSLLVNTAFYLICALFIAIVLCYFIFAYRISVESGKINELDEKMIVYASEEQKASEKAVFDYKKRTDDFAIIINNHKISSNVFNFLEEKTLSNVWFLSINVSEIKNEISLSGESENMETLSNQLKIFEESKDYIDNINVLSSQITTQGRTKFTLNLSLNPKIFLYEVSDVPLTP